MDPRLLSLLGLATITVAATTTGSSIPDPLPTAFPESTQTHFNSPSCTGAAAASLQSLTVNYNFETVERFASTSETTPIGVYNLLNFLNIDVIDTDPDLDGNHLGLAPHTYPNAATFSPTTSLLAGLLTLGTTSTVPVITANYTESTISSFTPLSWWYGCVLPSPAAAGSLPANCTITAKGYDVNGRAVPAATQTFGFAANGSVVQDQKFATFGKGFAGVYSLGFGVESEGSVAVALVDNFIATVTQEACAPFYTGSYENGT